MRTFTPEQSEKIRFMIFNATRVAKRHDVESRSTEDLSRTFKYILSTGDASEEINYLEPLFVMCLRCEVFSREFGIKPREENENYWIENLRDDELLIFRDWSFFSDHSDAVNLKEDFQREVSRRGL